MGAAPPPPVAAGALGLLGGRLHRLALALGREVDGLLGGQVRGARVPGEGRVLHERQVALGIVLHLGPQRGRLLGLLGLVQRVGVVDLQRRERQRGVGLLRLQREVGAVVGVGLAQRVLAGLGHPAVLADRKGRRERVVVAGERLASRLVGGVGLDPLLVLVHPLLDDAVAAAAPAAAVGEGIEEPAGHVAADAEEDQPSSHQDGEGEVGGLHHASALALDIEQHAWRSLASCLRPGRSPRPARPWARAAGPARCCPRRG